MLLGHLDIHMQMSDTGTIPHNMQIINSKWIIDLRLNATVIKVLEGNRNKSLGSWNR